MSAAPFPRRDPQAWQVQIGSTSFDMKVVKSELHGLETGATFDEDKATGVDGASLRFKGDELSTFTIRLECWTEEGLRQVLEACRYVRKKSRESGIAVSHPMLADAEVASMVVKKIKWPDCSGKDKPTAEFSCTQWRPKKTTKKSVAKTLTSADNPGDILSTAKKKKIPPPPAPWEQKVPT